MLPDEPQDNPFDDAALERGRKLFAGDCTFATGAVNQAGLPAPGRCEIAFAGRSNVGKSSLINALTSRKALARTSNTPGRTREINFFALGPSHYIVDLPGYGYARASRDKVEAWTRLVLDYLTGRQALARVFVLIDARHGIKPSDEEIMDLLDKAAVSYQIVLTKADKIKPPGLTQLKADTLERLARRPAAHPVLHATSSTKGLGLAELRADIAALAAS